MFEQMRTESLAILDTDPNPLRRRGGHPVQLRRDAAIRVGCGAPLESYRTANPEWDVIIDVDKLAEADGQSWVWGGADVIEPDLSRGFDSAFPGGSDAVTVREFDMATRTFVDDGFPAARAKIRLAWKITTHCWWEPTSARIR